MRHVVLRATWHEGTAQLLSLTEMKAHLFEGLLLLLLLLLLLAEQLTDKGGEETGAPGETPGGELQKMPHTEARKFKPQARLEPGGRLGKQTC